MNPKMVVKKARPHPGPLPQGEGEVVAAFGRNESGLVHGINARMVRGTLFPKIVVSRVVLEHDQIADPKKVESASPTAFVRA
jgi:hypothetical protein